PYSSAEKSCKPGRSPIGKRRAGGEFPARPGRRAAPVGASGMDATRPSLLLRAQGGDQSAWQTLTTLYRPLIVGWLQYQSVPAHEVDDLVQDTLLAVVRSLPSFAHTGQRGAFRAWLRSITRNRSSDFWNTRGRQALASGDSGVADTLRQLEDPGSELN